VRTLGLRAGQNFAAGCSRLNDGVGAAPASARVFSCGVFAAFGKKQT